ncbi:MAG: MoaD/ThiS family protein [Planctomycetaceae bacterium]
MVHIEIPYHLRRLALADRVVALDIDGPVTVTSVLDALEARYPALRGTIREHGTLKRRPLIRFYACQQDISHDSPDIPLPEPIANGTEPLLIVGAVAGG